MKYILISLLLIGHLFAEGNNGFLMNQKYVCINQGMVSGDNLIPIMSKDDAMKYPTRFYVDSNNILHTDDPNQTKYKHLKESLYIHDETLMGLKVVENKRYMTQVVKIKGITAVLLYFCVETDNWTLVR